MAINTFDVPTTRRLSISLMSAAGALLFACLNLAAAGISAGNSELVANLEWPKAILAWSAASGLISLLFAEVAAHESTPDDGHPHSSKNYLESAFALLSVQGLFSLVVGGFWLVSVV